jgi:asparagine synthase (glutamine-hydrolysing)
VSAIAGIYHRSGQPVDPAELARMSARLAHRGSDGAGAWQAGPVGLAHRLFWTTPESLHEQQPLVTNRPEGVLALSADARLDNRAELAPLLGLADSALTDDAFILAAYEKWGEACPEHLVGDYAFAVWDGPRQRLFCARDALGLKPFFYYDSPQLFAFASEIKGLFALPQVPRAPNAVQIANYLIHRPPEAALTYYESVKHLAAGHCLTVTASGAVLRQYWAPDLNHELRLGSDDEYAQAFLEIFREAVRCRLRSAFPAASMLSGGLDSSSVTCMAREVLAGQPLPTFSIIFNQAHEADERRYMHAVAASGDPGHHEVPGDDLSSLNGAEWLLWHMEEPFRHLGLYYQWLTYQNVERQGLRLLLSGNGGDALVSLGLFRLAELTRRLRWRALGGELREFAAARERNWRWAGRVWWEFGGKPLVPNWARRARRALRGPGRPVWSVNSFAQLDFARALDRQRALKPDWQQPRSDREDHWQGVEQASSMADHYERSAPAWHLEQRHPLMDRRLAEFCISLPAEQKFDQGQTRLIFRRAMQGRLPELIRSRGSKATPLYSMAPAILRYDRPRLEACLLEQNEALKPYVDLAAVERAYRALPGPEAPAVSYWGKLSELVQVALLGLWLQQDLTALQPAAVYLGR